MAASCRYTGEIASLNPGRGWGFIHCPELFDQYGKDVFLHKDYMDSDLQKGDVVSFVIELRQQDGMPQARDIKAKGAPSKGSASSAAYLSPKVPIGGRIRKVSGAGAANPLAHLPPPPAYPQRSAPGPPAYPLQRAAPRGLIRPRVLPRHFGTITRLNAERGWGFIHSPELLAQYGKDVFIHKDYIVEEFNEGDSVSFTVELRSDGKPQARDIGHAEHDGCAGHAERRGPASNGWSGTYSGAIARINAEKGWGFIHNPELLAQYGKDVFIHKDNMEGLSIDELNVGDAVSFTIELRKDGMPQAKNIVRQSDNQGATTTLRDNGRHTGKIASLYPEKGWGFVNAPELFALYGKDVFIHKDHMQELSIEELREGDVMSFSIELRKDGNPQGRNIMRESDDHGAMTELMGEEFHTGTVASVNLQKGFGFASSSALLARYGKDVFIHKDFMEELSIEQLSVGDALSFSIELRKDGMPQGRNITRASDAQGTTMELADDERHTGTVASLNPQRGWGFISSPVLSARYGKDVFIHKDYMNGEINFSVGDTVSFMIELRADGKPQARDIEVQKRRKT